MNVSPRQGLSIGQPHIKMTRRKRSFRFSVEVESLGEVGSLPKVVRSTLKSDVQSTPMALNIIAQVKAKRVLQASPPRVNDQRARTLKEFHTKSSISVAGIVIHTRVNLMAWFTAGPLWAQELAALGRPQHKRPMIGHQLVAQNSARVAFKPCGENAVKLRIVFVLAKDLAPRVSTIEPVVDFIRFISTLGSRHSRSSHYHHRK